MSRTIIDIHVLQTVPPSNINRDDSGSPKTAVFGGVRRARVSSQAWKRAMREQFRRDLNKDELGTRTKRVVEDLTGRIAAANSDLAESAETLAIEVFKAIGIKTGKGRNKEAPEEAGYLLFLSELQLAGLARAAVAAAEEDPATPKLDKAMLKKLADTENSVDIALFGRMVADQTDLNVDAACQVAHSISIHGVDNEYDYFTAIDDLKNSDVEEDAGAGMIGTVEFNSSTLLRYATVDVDRLQDNLGSVEATKRAVEAFVHAFVTSMPSGKQNTFANGTLPGIAQVTIREDQAVNLVGAFEKPVVHDDSQDYLSQGASRLASYQKAVEEAYVMAPVVRFVLSVGDQAGGLLDQGERANISDLVGKVGALVAERLTEAA